MSMTKRSRAMRIGIAGLGAGAVNALAATPGLTSHPNIQLVAAADPRPEARDAFASRYGGRTYASVEELCKASDIDTIYILTPNALHAEHAIIAAEHGKQVIADKPMALTLDDCDAMIRAAERNGVRLLVGHSQSLDSGILKMIEIIRSGVLGRPIMIASSYYNEWLYRPRSRETNSIRRRWRAAWCCARARSSSTSCGCWEAAWCVASAAQPLSPIQPAAWKAPMRPTWNSRTARPPPSLSMRTDILTAPN